MFIFCVMAIKKESMISLALTDLFNGTENRLALIKSEAENYEEFIKELKNHNANVILLDKACAFAKEDALAKLLMMFPAMLVIIVSEESNWLKIFRREDRLMASPADLMDVIVSPLIQPVQ